MKAKINLVGATKTFLSALLLSVLIAGCEREPVVGPDTSTETGQLKSAPVKGFTIVGTKLIDDYGNEFVMRGVSYPFNWYDRGDSAAKAIPAIAATGANAVRLVIENGTKATAIQTIYDLCVSNKLIVILENHSDVTCKSDTAPLFKAARKFAALKDVLIGKEDKLIINIANEWSGVEDNKYPEKGYNLAYQKAVKIIRDAGLNHTIMIDGNSCGEGYKIIIDYGNQILQSDSKKNIIFSVHGYQNIAHDSTVLKTALEGIRGQGLAVCIGEFGWKHSGSDVDQGFLMKYCYEQKIGWLAWSWGGNDAGTKYLDMCVDFAGINLTAWGDTVINGPYGLKTPGVSKPCSVFSTIPPGQPGNYKTIGPMSIYTSNTERYAAFAKWGADIHDGVKFYNADGTEYASIGTGSPITPDPEDIMNPNETGDNMILGVGAHAKDIICGLNKGLVLREPGPQVTGDIYARGDITGTPNPAFGPYTGTMLENLSSKYYGLPCIDIFADIADFQYGDNPLFLNPPNSPDTIDIAPGNYGTVSIGSRNIIAFQGGTYNFYSFTTQPDVELYFPPNEKVIIFVYSTFSIQSRTKMLNMINGEKKGANPANILVVCGSGYDGHKGAPMDIYPQVNWRGTLVCPNGILHVFSNDEGDVNGTLKTPVANRYETMSASGEIYGALWARRLIIHQRTAVYFVPLNWSEF